MRQFPHLLSPLSSGNLSVRNRVVSTAHATCLPTDEGHVSDQMVHYHAARARGGVGLIITESMSVHPTSKQLHRVVSMWDDAVVPSVVRLTSTVHEHGARILCQLHHSGRQQDYAHVQWPPVSASDVPCSVHRHVPHALSLGEIDELVDAFADAGERALAGGYDGVEVHCAHGYLIHQFMSPSTNLRRDDYGGTLENRLRFARRILRAVRSRIGDRAVLGIRLNGEEFVEGGLHADDFREIAVKLQQESIDYLSITYGLHSTPQYAIPPMTFAEGAFLEISTAFKEIAKVPLLISHRIKSVVMAEELVASGKADLVGMTRAMIADPDLVQKAASGREADIRPCIGVLQGCISRVRMGFSIGCMVNPEAGREGNDRAERASPNALIVIAGGGPAGVQAGISLLENGYNVALFEESSRLGGQLRLASSLPGRAELRDFIDWQERQFRQLGGFVHLETRLTPELLDELEPSVLVAATGSRHSKPDPRFSTGEVPVFGLVDGLSLELGPGERVVIVDHEYRNIGLLLALRFRDMGAEPLLLSIGNEIATDLDAANRHDLVERLTVAGGSRGSHARVVGVTERTMAWEHEGWEVQTDNVVAIVLVKPPVADTRLANEIERLHPDLPVHVIGDALSPDTAEAAIRTAHVTARRIAAGSPAPERLRHPSLAGGLSR